MQPKTALSAGSEAPQSFKDVENLGGFELLLEQGVILRSKDMRRLAKILSPEDRLALTQRFAELYYERFDDRLAAEILIESLIVYFHGLQDERYIKAFARQILGDPRATELIQGLIEVSLANDLSTDEKLDELFAMAVITICHTGLELHREAELMEFEEDYVEARKLLDRISTYLLSVSNSSDMTIRLSLFHYFGTVEHGLGEKTAFNRVAGRFGHTVLEQLFGLLFDKRSEALALSYLLDLGPLLLAGDHHTQNIFHETAKFYMLKKPERFALFIEALGEELRRVENSESVDIAKCFMQHVAMLFKVASEVNHRELMRSMLEALGPFKSHPYLPKLCESMLADPALRGTVRDELRRTYHKLQAGEAQFGPRSSKRGRKPSLAKDRSYTLLEQVLSLGAQATEQAA